jgi:hypothetical protein
MMLWLSKPSVAYEVRRPHSRGLRTTEIQLLASRQYRVIALTNNYAVVSEGISDDELSFLGWHEGPTPPRLRALFDDFCDSSTMGMRSVADKLRVRVRG